MRESHGAAAAQPRLGEEDRDGRTRIDEKPEFKFFKPTFFKPSAVPFVVQVRASLL